MNQNVIEDDADVASRIAARTASRRRRPDYAAEVRALLDAARTVIASTGKARVADIIAEAGLSNDAFYRHFPSKDALVAALTEEGTERVAASLARKMAQEPTPADQVRCWLDGILERTTGDSAMQTLTLLNASSNFNTAIPTGAHEVARLPFARLLHGPFTDLGSADPVLDAELVTHAVTNRVAGHLWTGTTPSEHERERLLTFCLTIGSLR
ncbi:MAG TPA: TetR/AcrR family transcriptional regulator [Acidimicrobiales bacterium]|nr:TetR/AcrR family transcriptional regulator [Acidimicrobiales bacterium]